ncbi:MAG: hypothetical protein ACC628_07365 [Pirellulaceae bacterium]
MKNQLASSTGVLLLFLVPLVTLVIIIAVGSQPPDQANPGTPADIAAAQQPQPPTDQPLPHPETPLAESSANSEAAGSPRERIEDPAPDSTASSSPPVSGNARSPVDEGTTRPADMPDENAPPSPPIVAIPNERPGQDLLASIRDPVAGIAYEAYWNELDQALRHLRTLDGASYDSATARLTLIGDFSKEEGPFRLEDLVVAMRAEFHEIEPLGVTIDPVPEDPNGPVMVVKFFAGAEDTHFGRVMFEADRLLKCLGLGKHNETNEPVTSHVEGFHPIPELDLALASRDAGSVWSRFWIVPALDQFPDDDSRGKPVVAVADNGHTIWFEHVRLFVRTEIMHAQSTGELVSSGGDQDKAAAYFANLMTAKFDEFAAEFPALADLRELSKLLVLAKWMREQEFVVDNELLYLRYRGTDSATPRETPTLSVSASSQSGNAIRHIKLFGGVEMRVRPFYAADEQKHAQQFSAIVAAQPPRALLGTAHRPAGNESRPKLMVNLKSRARGPPSNPPRAPAPRRRALRVVESEGAPNPTLRDGNTSFLAVRPKDTPVEQTTLQGFDLPVFQDPKTGGPLLNLPVLRLGYNPRAIRTAQVEMDGRKYEQRFADYLYLTSPLRDIHLRFETKPKFHPQRREFFFPAKNPAAIGFFPKSSSVELKDGTILRFSPENGLLTAIGGAGKPSLEVSHPVYQEGPLVIREERSFDQFARPPPSEPAPKRRPVVVRMSRGEVVPTARPASHVMLSQRSFSRPRIEVRNRSNGKVIRAREQAGQLVFVESEVPAATP